MAGVNPALAAYRAGGGASGVKTAPTPAVHPALATYRSSVIAPQVAAAKRQASADYVTSQKNAPPIKAASPDLFGSTGWGHILSHITNAATAVARIPASIVGSTVEGVLGTGSAGGDVPQAQKAQVVKNEQAGKQSTNVKPANTGKAQSVVSQGAGALSARFLVAAPAEKFIQEYVGSKIPGLAGEVTAKAAATAHQAGLVNALGTAADPNATHADVMKSYATGVATGLGLGAGGKLLGAGVKGVAEKLPGDSGGGKVTAPKPVVTAPRPVSTARQAYLAKGEAYQAAKQANSESLITQAAKSAGPESPHNGVVGELHNLINPVPGAEGKIAKNDLRASVGKLELEKAQMNLGTKSEVKFWDKQKPVDNLTFIHAMESGARQATPELEAKAAAFRKWFNGDYKLASQLKGDLPYVKNYFTHNGLWKNPQEAERFYESWMKQQKSLGGKPGALEQRSFPTIIDGLKAGLQIKETNPQVLANANRASLLRAKMAQEFQQESIAKGISPVTTQRLLDRHLSTGFNNSDIYRSARTVGNTLNQAQLGLSGFHALGTSINSVISQFSNGLNDILRLHPVRGAGEIATAPFAPLRNVLKGSKIIKDFKAGNITADIKNIAEGGGRIGQPIYYKATGLAKSLEQIQSGTVGGVAKGVAAAPVRALSVAAKPIMEWWVPRLKLSATKDLIDSKLLALGKDASPDVIRAAKAEAVDSIDNRFGQLVQDNLFWDQHIKDMMHLAMRSPGWNIGTVREVGGGAINLLKPKTYLNVAKGKGLPENSSYALSLAVVTMALGGTMQYLYTGQWPSSSKDYFFPRTGKTDKNGNPERISLPTYAKDIFAFMHSPTQTLKNKANPFIAETQQLGANSDYFGNQIRNPQDSGGTQAKQVGSYLLKANLPFSVTNSNQRVDKSASTKAQSYLGINPAPGYITKSPFEQRVSNALNLALGSKPETPEQAALVNEKSQAKQAAQGGDQSQIDQMVQQGKITKKQGDNLKKSAKGTSLQNSFTYLMTSDRASAARVLKSASPADIRKLGNLQAIRSQMYKSIRSRNSSPATVKASKDILSILGN